MTNYDADKRLRLFDAIIIAIFVTIFFSILAWLIQSGNAEAQEIMEKLITEICTVFGMVVFRLTRDKKNK